MRILQVTRQFYPSTGGVENVVWYLTKHLQASGYEVDVVSLNRLFDQSKIHLPCQEKVDGIKIRRLPYWGSRRYAIAPKVLSLVKSYDNYISIAVTSFRLLALQSYSQKVLSAPQSWYFFIPLCSQIKGIFFTYHTSGYNSKLQQYLR